jgi:hypothetical protein
MNKGGGSIKQRLSIKKRTEKSEREEGEGEKKCDILPSLSK